MEYFNIINDEYIAAVKKHLIIPYVRIVLLDKNENAYREITSEISVENAGSISSTFQQGIQKTVSLTIFDPDGEFIPDPNNQNFWIGSKFKVYLGLMIDKSAAANNTLVNLDMENNILISNYDNAIEKTEWQKDIYWFSKGVYIITSIGASHSLADKTITISGADKFSMFTQDTGYNEMIANYLIKQGTTIGDAIITILLQDQGNGYPLDPIVPIIDPYFINTVIPYDVEKGAGSYMGDILIELATMFKADLFYDNDGHLNFKRSMIGDENVQLPIIWDFYDIDSEYISSSIDYNLADAINTVFVVGDNPNAAIAPEFFLQNNNAASPLAVSKIGVKSRLYTSSMIQTPTEAQDYAYYMLNQLSRIQQTISFTCTYMPHLDINNAFTLTDDFYNISQGKYIIQSITFPIGIGTLAISASNIEELPTY